MERGLVAGGLPPNLRRQLGSVRVHGIQIQFLIVAQSHLYEHHANDSSYRA